jgi:hypothetical protein
LQFNEFDMNTICTFVFHQPLGVFGWLQADTVAAVWTAAAAIHREKNTVEAAAAAGLQPQQAAANSPFDGDLQFYFGHTKCTNLLMEI